MCKVAGGVGAGGWAGGTVVVELVADSGWGEGGRWAGVVFYE